MNETLTMLEEEQTKGEKNLRAAKEKDWQQTESKPEQKSVPEYLSQAKSLAEKLLKKLDPDAPELDEELVPESGYLKKSYDLMARITLSNGETFAIYINTNVGPENSASSLSVCQFSEDEISDPKYQAANKFENQHQKVGLYMLIFPVDRSRSFFFGDKGGIRKGWDDFDDDADLLQNLEENINSDWQILKKGFENSGVLRS